MRSQPFGPGGEGLVVKLILEDQRRVVVLRVTEALIREARSSTLSLQI